MRHLLPALLAAALVAPAQQSDFFAATRAMRELQRTSQASAEAKARAAKLIEEGGGLQRAGRGGGARRAMANAAALLRGENWDETAEFMASLVLRPDRAVADPSRTVLIQLTQAWPAAPPSRAMRLKVSAGANASEHEIPARDLIDQPFVFEAPLQGLPDGENALTVELSDGAAAVARIEQKISLVNGIESQRAAVEQRLGRIQGHEGAKATVRFPYDLARAVNLGIRKLGTNDFGLSDAGTMTYDFAAGLRSSAATLRSLESGKDPVHRAKGDHERHYWFAEAGEIMPYRVYAPTTWDGKAKLPMLLVLHGNTRDHNYYFDRDAGILPKLAEKYGFVVACPMGYRPNAGYNANSLRPRQPGGGSDPGRARQGELSEKDAMNVLELVASEYGVDRSRIFLFGHSAGGAGTWFLGSKYTDKFAGMAISAAGTRAAGYPFEKLKGMPLMVFHGSKDTEAPLAATLDMLKGLKDHGIAHIYEEVEGATHATIVAMVEPKVFEYFRAIGRR